LNKPNELFSKHTRVLGRLWKKRLEGRFFPLNLRPLSQNFSFGKASDNPMLRMLFYIRFQTQLRRTRPKLLSTLENSVSQAIKNSGGETVLEHQRISAIFTENSPGFWLDILTVLETTLAALEKAAPDLYDYTIMIAHDISENDALRLTLAVPVDSQGTGFWCSPQVQEALAPYVVFDEPFSKKDSPLEGYAQINRIRTFSEAGIVRTYPLREKIRNCLNEGEPRNVLLVGPEYQGKRDGLYRFCLSGLKKAPPLVIRFGAGGTGLCCFSDALNSGIRSFLSKSIEPPELEELDTLGAIIFRERFQYEYPDYILQKGRRFFQLLTDVYIKAAAAVQDKPIFILEDIQKADAAAAALFVDLYQPLSFKETVHIYGTWSTGPENNFTDLSLWTPVFSRVLQLTQEDIPAPELSEVPRDLWEIAYALVIFLQYFPGSLVVDLFEEAGKNPAMIHRAFSLLAYFGIIDILEEPRLRVGNIVEKAEAVLGERKDSLCLIVRNRLLAWVQAEKLRPCFNILKALVSLGWEGTDELILKALQMDVIYGTFGEIEKSLADGAFGRILGQDSGAALRHIYKTSKALIHGGEKEVREAFFEPDPEVVSSLMYEIQILMNRANYLLSIRDTSVAINTIKKSIMIIQGERKQWGLAHAYRLFALASLSNQRINDAMDYSSFAMESMEKSMDSGELGLIYFYAAEIQFLVGNIFKAESLIIQAEEAALNAGRLEWAERARFFRGRLRFESGRYQDALTIFESMQKDLSGYKRSAVGQALSAWIYRSNIYLQNYSGGKPKILTGEGLIFQLEASYLSGDYERTAKYSELLLDVLEDQNFLFIEQPNWDSAYAQCELFIFPKAEIFFRIGSVFRALALCRLKQANHEDYAEALRLIRQVIQDERLSVMDPSDAFYFYAYYLILKDSGAQEIDMNTVASIAFKRLQRRASQIDDMETKHSFLSRHHWNRALYQVAREHKLI
jgi:tetratricopeptide (TPR) repeat protein